MKRGRSRAGGPCHGIVVLLFRAVGGAGAQTLAGVLTNSFFEPPPLPLQELSPLQACFSIVFLLSSACSPAEIEEPDPEGVGCAARAAVPATSPAKAAASSQVSSC